MSDQGNMGAIGGIIQAVAGVIFAIIEKVKAYEQRRAHKYWYGTSSGNVLVTRKQDEWIEWLRNDPDYLFNAVNIALIQRTAGQRCLGQLPDVRCNDGHRPYWCDYYELLGRVATELPHKYHWKWYYMLGNSWYHYRSLKDYNKERDAGRPAPSKEWVKKAAKCLNVGINANARVHWPRHPRAVDFCLFLCEYGLFKPGEPPPPLLDLHAEGLAKDPVQGWKAQGIFRTDEEVDRQIDKIREVYKWIDEGEFDRAALEIFGVDTKKLRDQMNAAAQAAKQPKQPRNVEKTPMKLNAAALIAIAVIILLLFLL